MNEDQEKRFKLRVSYLNRLEVPFHTEEQWKGVPGKGRGPQSLNLFRSIQLPFTDHEWVRLTKNDGTFYVGGCCGNTSAVQGQIEGIYRLDTGWVDIDKLAIIAEAMANHDGDCDGKENEFSVRLSDQKLADTVAGYADSLGKLKKKRDACRKMANPWTYMAMIWQIVRDFYDPARLSPPAPEERRDPVEDAVRTLNHGFYVLDTCWLYDHFGSDNVGEDGSFQFGDKKKPKRMQKRARDLIMLARMLPALKTFSEKIASVSQPIEGFAIVNKESPEDIQENGYGPCIMATREECEEIFALWDQRDAEYSKDKEADEDRKPVKARESMKIRKAKVSMAKGVEFYD